MVSINDLINRINNR